MLTGTVMEFSKIQLTLNKKSRSTGLLSSLESDLLIKGGRVFEGGKEYSQKLSQNKKTGRNYLGTSWFAQNTNFYRTKEMRMK